MSCLFKLIFSNFCVARCVQREPQLTQPPCRLGLAFRVILLNNTELCIYLACRGSHISRSHHAASAPHSASSSHAAARGAGSRSSAADQPSAAPAGPGTPVKISRKDLRAMSEEEVSLRRSNMSRSSVGSRGEEGFCCC